MRSLEDGSSEQRFNGSFSTPPENTYGIEPVLTEQVEQRERPTWLRLPMHQPLFTYGILGILAIVFGLQQITPNFQVETQFMKVNEDIVAGEFYRLITATLLHGSILHILFNGYGIFLFGQQTESFFGRWRFLSIYILAGISGSIASFAFSPSPSLGASGALFGLVGALGVYFWVHRKLLGAQGRAQLWNVLFIAGINIVFGLSQSGIDNWGHIGGILGGIAAGAALVPHYRPGRETGFEERMLEDSTPTWVPPVASLAILLVESAIFALALINQGGHL